MAESPVPHRRTSPGSMVVLTSLVPLASAWIERGDTEAPESIGVRTTDTVYFAVVLAPEVLSDPDPEVLRRAVDAELQGMAIELRSHVEDCIKALAKPIINAATELSR